MRSRVAVNQNYRLARSRADVIQRDAVHGHRLHLRLADRWNRRFGRGTRRRHSLPRAIELPRDQSRWSSRHDRLHEGPEHARWRTQLSRHEHVFALPPTWRKLRLEAPHAAEVVEH